MRLIDGDYLYNKLVANKCPYDLVLQMVKDEPTVDVLDKIRDEIEKCLEAINHIKAMPIQLYTPNEIEARKLTYEQCLGFIDKYTEGGK